MWGGFVQQAQGWAAAKRRLEKDPQYQARQAFQRAESAVGETVGTTGSFLSNFVPEEGPAAEAPIQGAEPEIYLPNVEHERAWTPPPVVLGVYEAAIDVAADPSRPWYERVAAGAGAVIALGPTAGEQIVHGIIALPQSAAYEAIAAGEHATRAVLLVQIGATDAAIDEGLAMTQSWLEAESAAMGTAAMVGGFGQAIASRSQGTVVYQLVDELGEPVYYGLTRRPITVRLGEHARTPPGPFQGLQVISEPMAQAQAQSLETSLIQQAQAEGRVIYNVAESSIAPGTPVEVPPTIQPGQTHLNPKLYPR
jgi:hypothetical protein